MPSKKTYSIAFMRSNGEWCLNSGVHDELEHIKWDMVENAAIEMKAKSYGYVYGRKSNRWNDSVKPVIVKTMN